MDFPGGSMVKNLPANAGDVRDMSRFPGQKDPLKKDWQPVPVFCLENSRGRGPGGEGARWGRGPGGEAHV